MAAAISTKVVPGNQKAARPIKKGGMVPKVIKTSMLGLPARKARQEAR